MEKKDITFVVRHYRKGRFDADAGWSRLGMVRVSFWKKYRVAAAVAATVVLSATAAMIYHEYRIVDAPQRSIEVYAESPLAEVKIIDFENASLPEVINKIESVYNVKVQNLPDNQDDYELSLHYEGTPADLVAVINDILGTQITVTEK